MSTLRATQMRMEFSDDTNLKRDVAIRCFQVPSPSVLTD
jgi:hypothetical protein